jgi:hypothetical protein
MQFNHSPRGHHFLAYNSSRIYVLDVRGPTIDVKREFKIMRRPACACIKDDGTLLAVLSTEMQVDIYDLQQSPPKRTQSIILDNAPRTIALSPCGSVLAAAYEGGIEVTTVNPAALATDRRAVKCDAVDALAFSFDGTQLLGTTIHSFPANTVILTAPYYDPGSHLADDNISALWTTSILFPNTSRDCSHAVLLQNSSHEEASWTFTYDRSFETFRAVRIDDLRNGTTYFTGPIPSPTSQARLLPCTLPAATYHGELVSAGFQGKDIWLYGVPEDLDAIPDNASSGTESGSSAGGLGRRNSGPSSRASSRMQESGGARVPQWQLLCDKLRNTFVGGCKVGELDGVSNVKWVAGFGSGSSQERLVITARGIMPPKPITEEDDFDFVDGGRITFIDFDYGFTNGLEKEITIEVGTKEPEILEEEQRDMEQEVAIVRRRTVAQRRGKRGQNHLLRAATTASREAAAAGQNPSQSRSRDNDNENDDDDDDPLVPRRVGAAPRRNLLPESPVTDDMETASIDEQEALDAPYSHASPRSGTTLRRAATAAAQSRRIHPQTAAAAGQITYRRADGRAEHPHESDADNWVPPPPPYQKDDPGDLPAFLRHNATQLGASTTTPRAPPAGTATDDIPPVPALPIRTQTAVPAAVPSSWPLPMPQRTQTSVPAREQAPLPSYPPSSSSHIRIASDSTTVSRPRRGSNSRPMSSPSVRRVDIDDLYDVSPPDSPRLRAMAASPDSMVSTQNIPSVQRSVVPPLSGEWSSPMSSHASPSTASTSPATTRVGPTLHTRTRPNAPTLDLQIPSPTISTLNWNNNSLSSAAAGDTPTGPSVRRLSNSQTWPRVPQPQTQTLAVAPAAIYPYSAPATGANANDMMSAALPPAPRPDQLASLNTRGDLSSPRRTSGQFQLPRVPVGSRAGMESPRNSLQQPIPPINTHGISSIPPPDQPLIISTPKGVTGAFDPPDRQASSRRVDPPIFAPVARHPRPVAGSTVNRPTVERLETIYSGTSENQAQGGSSRGGFMPSWLSTAPSSSAGSRHPNINRKPSRAERSAARNMQDARRRGWNGGKKKKSKKKEIDYEVASSAAWTDVSRTTVPGEKSARDKKCVVM